MAGRGEQASPLEQQHSPENIISLKNVYAGPAVTNSLSQELRAGWLQPACQGGQVNKTAKAPNILRILTLYYAPGVSYVSMVSLGELRLLGSDSSDVLCKLQACLGFGGRIRYL